MIAQGVMMGVKAVRGVGEAAHEQHQRRSVQQSTRAARQYVVLEDAGAATRDASNVTSFSAVSKLKMQLRVPDLRFSLPFASACNFPKAQLLELHGATSAAQLTLGQAAAAATRAQARAGFEAGVSKIALGGIRGAMPMATFLATGFRLDAQSWNAATKEMQEAELLLGNFWQQLQPVLSAMKGTIAFTAPKQPLALTALLDTLQPGGTMSLSSCEHPIIQALCLNHTYNKAVKTHTDKDTREGDDQHSDGLVRTLVASVLDKDGKGADRVKSTLASRFKKEDKQPGKAKSAIRDVLKSARGSDGGMSAAQIEDRTMATAIAAGTCDADNLEFERLTEQIDEVRRWLLE